MKLANTFAVAALALTAAVGAFEAEGVTLNVDQVKQRYPWNGLVDIDYTIVNDNGAVLGVDDNLEVMLVDGDETPAVTHRALTFLQAPLPLTAGAHRITWDANADGVTNRIDKAKFIVKIAHYSAVYMVIDVSTGPGDDAVYKVDFLNGTPPKGFNDPEHPEYKGDKIVLRLIRPGSYVAGSPADEANRTTAARETQHRVAITKPFYIGLFEITQKQYLNVMGGTNPAQNKDDYRPVENVTYANVRGGNWPTTTAPDENTFMGKLIAKCKSRDPMSGEYTVAVGGFDLPTEFEREYACRAGTTHAFNTTNSFDNSKSGDQVEQLAQLGRYKDNQTDGRGGFTKGHTTVGAYLPNAWGLYDMHGNVWEWCRDWFVDDPTLLDPRQYVDPKGPLSPNSNKERVTRGGGWSSSVGDCRSAPRYYAAPTYKDQYLGFRLSRSMP